MDIQRLRNLTTKRLHTEMSDIYEDLGEISGVDGLLTHMLPRMLDAVTPWLRSVITDERFWDGKYDTSHTGNFDLPQPSAADRASMLKAFSG